MRAIPRNRRSNRNTAPVRLERSFVLYWMIGARRPTDNFALQHALHLAETLRRPLVVFEPLRCGYRWASERIHRFVIDGMMSNQHAFARPGITYLPYVEPLPGAGRGLLRALATRACAVVTDHTPGFFIPRMVDAAATHLDVRLEAVDSNGILPLFEAPRVFTTAASFRRYVQKTVLSHIEDMPEARPLVNLQLPPAADLRGDWLAPWFGARPGHNLASIRLDTMPLDHRVSPLPMYGGPDSAVARWSTFRREGLGRYHLTRQQLDDGTTSGLSPYLHFGHIGAHTLVRDLLADAAWDPSRVAPKATGSRAGWWSLSEPVEAFIDQLLTWRELGYTFCHLRPDDHGRYESLPDWARQTLDEHAGDPRPVVYSLEELEGGATHDPLWNAAQAQLVQQGVIHNYLRMLWGKKILEWSEHPRVALEHLVELNNRYAIDGRDPNSWSGIFWTLGRFDRAWGPERPIFGKVRYMSSQNTARKVRVNDYIRTWSNP